MTTGFTLTIAIVLVLGHAIGTDQDRSDPYGSQSSRPMYAPGWKSGDGRLTEFDVLSDALNQFHAEGRTPKFYDFLVDYRKTEYGQNRFLISGPEMSPAPAQAAQDDRPYRAVLTRTIFGPSWKAGQKGYLAFPEVTDALNQLHREGYEPIHMELYTEPMPESRRVKYPPMNRLLVIARRM